MDEELRRLERAARDGDEAAREILVREVERRGLLRAFEEELVEALRTIEAEEAASVGARESFVRDVADAIRKLLEGDLEFAAIHHVTHALARSDGHGVEVVLIRGKRALHVRGEEVLRLFRSGMGRGAAVSVSWGTAFALSRSYWWAPRRGEIAGIRMRPVLYAGPLDAHGHVFSFDEILVPALAFAALDECGRIDVALTAEAVGVVEHDGPGLAPDVLERFFLLFGEVSPEGHYRVDRRESFVVGPRVVNATSAWLAVESRHDGVLYRQRFERGWPVAPVERVGPTSGRGVRVSFAFDPLLWEEGPRADLIEARVRELAALYPQVAFSFSRDGSRPVVVERRWGLLDALGRFDPLIEPIHGETEPEFILDALESPGAEVALTWARDGRGSVLGFANDHATRAGTHVEALVPAVTVWMSRIARERRRGLDHDVFERALVAVVRVKLEHAAFEGQTRERLWNEEVRAPVRVLVARVLDQFARERPEEVERLLDRFAPPRE